MPSSTTSGGANRPASKNRRKEKGSVGGVNQFGRTFFHPPGGVSNGPPGYEHANNNPGGGPALIDHN